MARGGSSRIRRYRRCRHGFWYSDVLDIDRKSVSLAPYKGSVVHECLEEYYNGRDWTKPVKELKIQWDRLFDEERAEWGNLPQEVYRIMRGYINAYKHLDATQKTLGTEVFFEMPLAEGKHTYTGIIDRLYEDSEGVWVEDFKTASALPSKNDLYMDLQPLMYFDACRHVPELQKLLEGKRLAGVIFNHIRTKAPREPKILKSGAVSKAACDTDVFTYFEVVKRQGLNVNDYKDMIPKLSGNVFFRRTKIPVSERTLDIIKREIITTMDEIDFYTDKAEVLGQRAKPLFTRTSLKRRCDWDCPYRELCFAELSGIDIQSIIDEKFVEREVRYDGQ